ncbi:MAG: hypothetical protein RLZZ628_2950 [Bacteroidota bacterium]|jgi:hypothetical protein
MTLNIDLPQVIEQQLIQEAFQKGISLDYYLATVLKQVVYKARQKKAKRNLSESAILKQINLSVTEAEWNEYRRLIALRQSETISALEYAHLIALGDKIEAANVQRLKYLVKLAQLRQVSLLKVMQDLGVKPVEL